MTCKLNESVFLEPPSIALTDPIRFEDLLKRWPKVSRETIIDLVSEKILAAYISINDEVNADGERVHESKPINPGASIYSKALCNHDTVSIAFMLHKIVFDMQGILHFEQKNGYSHNAIGLSPHTTPNTSMDQDIYTCDRLAGRWGCDQRVVLHVLNNRRAGALKYSPDVPINAANELASLYVTHNDLSLWEAENKGRMFRSDFGATSDDAPESLRKSSEGASASFNTANTEGRQKLDNFKEPMTIPVKKTARASDVKREITAKDWAKNLEKAVALAVDCAKSGKPKSIKQHQAMWAKLWVDAESNEPRKAAFRAFRKGLPSELKFKNNRES